VSNGVCPVPSFSIYRSEWSAYVELGFDLNAEAHEVYPHFARLLQVNLMLIYICMYLYIYIDIDTHIHVYMH